MIKVKRAATTLALLALVSVQALADDHKHPTDKCPPGQHTVNIEHSTKSGGSLSGTGNAGVASGTASGNHERTTTERREVCRDNKDHNVKEKP